MKPCARFLDFALALSVTSSVAVAQAGSLATVRDSTLSVPAASLASLGVPGSTNLVGSTFMMSAIVPGTLHGGRAALVSSQEWVRRYNGGPYNALNRGQAIAVRRDGSIVVTGYSTAPATGSDFVTLAYAPDGTPLWTNRYDSANPGDDSAQYIATADGGDVWVAGHSGSLADWRLGNAVVIRYASNGVPVWTNAYTSGDTNSVYATALAVDGSGNAYVEAMASYFPSLGSGSPVEDAVIKYGADGTAVRTRHYFYSAPDTGEDTHDVEALALDGAGNLLIAGMTGSEHSDTGTSIVKSGADGTGIWTNHYPFGFMVDSPSLSVDREGGVTVTGERWDGSAVVYVVLKCSANGASLWTNFWSGPLYEGGNMPMTVPDPAGNVFLVGGSPGTSSGGLYQILKVSPGGIPLWTNLHADFGLTNSMLYGSAADSAGNLYLAAYAPAPGRSDRDWVTVKYSGDGQPVWTNRFAGPDGRDDLPFALAVDGAANVYVTGESATPYGSDLTTVKYADLLYYTPPKDFTGSDTITYTLTDKFGNSATGSVEVVVAPGAFGFNLSPAVTRLTPGGFQSQVGGAPATNAVVLEASSDLVHWEAVVTNAPIGSTVQFLDPAAATLPHRFYRARQPQ
jgi:Bacterial Ig domain